MPSEPEAGVSNIGGCAVGVNRTVFKNSRGNRNYYTFYTDVDTNGDHSVIYETSAAGQVAWGNLAIVIDFGNRATNNGWVHHFDVIFEEDSGNSQTEVWVVAIGYDGDAAAYQTKYVRGTIADASTTISWGTVQTIDAAINTSQSGTPEADPYCIALARTDNGRIVVAFTEDVTDKGKDYRQTYVIGADGDAAAPSWSGETLLFDVSGSNNNQDKWEVYIGMDNFSSSFPNRTYVYGRIPEATSTATYEVQSAAPDWDGSSFTNTTIYTEGTTSSVEGEAISGCVDQDTDLVHLLYRTGTIVLHYAQSGTAGSDSLISTPEPIVISAGTPDCCAIVLDKNIPTQVPNSDEASGSWSPSSGSDLYAMVDEGYPANAEYIETSTDPDTVRLGGYSGGIVPIFIRIAAVGGTAVFDLSTFKDGGVVETLISTQALTTIQYFYAVWPTDPDWNEISVRVTTIVGTSVRIYNLRAGGPMAYCFYHDGADTQDFNYRMQVMTIARRNNALLDGTGDEQTVSYHRDVSQMSSWRKIVSNQLVLGGMTGSITWFNFQPTYLGTLSTTLADLEWPDLSFFLGPHGT